MGTIDLSWRILEFTENKTYVYNVNDLLLYTRIKIKKITMIFELNRNI